MKIFEKNLFLGCHPRMNLSGICVFLVMWMLGCGGASHDSLPSVDGGGLKMIVSSSKTSSHELAEIKKYKVVIAGEGLSPIEKEIVSGESAVINGIPRGNKRTITVTGLNKDDTAVQEGIAENISISGGKTTPVEMPLEGIPLFLNLADGTSMRDNLLLFDVLSNSDDSFQITDETLETGIKSVSVLKDVVLGESALQPDDQGVIRFYPGTLSPGLHRFTVENLRTNKKTTVEVQLFDRRISGAPLLSSGSIKEEEGAWVPKRLGQPFVRTTKEGTHGELLSSMMEVLWK